MSDSKMVKVGLWKLSRENQLLSSDICHYVIAAASEKSAREIANGEAGTEGYVWLDGALVSSVYLGDAADGVYGVILRSSEEE